jgi:hypothetical protein
MLTATIQIYTAVIHTILKETKQLQFITYAEYKRINQLKNTGIVAFTPAFRYTGVEDVIEFISEIDYQNQRFFFTKEKKIPEAFVRAIVDRNIIIIALKAPTEQYIINTLDIEGYIPHSITESKEQFDQFIVGDTIDGINSVTISSSDNSKVISTITNIEQPASELTFGGGDLTLAECYQYKPRRIITPIAPIASRRISITTSEVSTQATHYPEEEMHSILPLNAAMILIRALFIQQIAIAKDLLVLERNIYLVRGSEKWQSEIRSHGHWHYYISEDEKSILLESKAYELAASTSGYSSMYKSILAEIASLEFSDTNYEVVLKKGSVVIRKE